MKLHPEAPASNESRSLLRRIATILRSTRSVAAASGVLAGATLASKLTGFLRIQAIASVFGASWRTDAFLTAFLIPECLYLFLTEGALSSALVPVFSQAMAHEKERRDPGAIRLLVTLSCAALIVGIPAALAVAHYRVTVAATLAPGFAFETQKLAGSLMLIVAGYIPLGLVGGVLQGYLNARGHFLTPALGPLVFNVVTVVATWTIARTLGIHALAWAVVLGGWAALLIQGAGLLGLRVPWPRRPDFTDPELRHAGRLLLPVTAAVVLVQGQVIVERIATSSLATGSVAAVNFASKILNLPAGLLALTVGTALLPTLAAAVNEGRREEADTMAASYHRLLFFLVTPAALWLMLNTRIIVRILLERGAFSAADSAVTASVLMLYAPALVPAAGSILLTRVFFAHDDSLSPSRIRVYAVIVNGIVLFALLPSLGILAIPLAMTVMHGFSYLALFARLSRRAPMATKGFTSEAWRQLVAGVVAMTVVSFGWWLFDLSHDLVSLVGSALVIGIVHPLAALVMGSACARSALSLLRRESAR